MNVAGSFTLASPRDEVYAAICDPAVLLAVIPGAEAVEQVSPGEYRGRIALRLPGFAGAYRTTVRLVDTTPPEGAAMEGRVEGALGSIEGRAEFTLAAEAAGGTLLRYSGRAAIQGPLARLDSRFAERLAESLISQGLRTLDDRLAAARSGTAAAAGRGQARTEAPE